MTQTFYRASLDNLTLPLDLTQVPAGKSVVVCFSRSMQVPENPVWYAATNNGDGTVTILVGPTTPALATALTAGCWFVMAQVTDSPAIPVYFAGDLYVLD